MTPPRISIVIPAYNQATFLPATLESVRAQTFADWELVAVDDGSTDHSGAVIEEFSRRDPRIRLLRQENRGVAHTRNHGFALTDSRSEFVIFLDGDDIWRPAALVTLLAALEANPAAPAAHSIARFIDETNQPHGNLEEFLRERQAIAGRRLEILPPSAPTTFAALAVNCWIVTPGTCLIRRRALDGIPGFLQEFATSEDWEFWLRLARLHGGFIFVDRTLIDYRRHANAVSANGKRMQQARQLIMAHVLADTGLNPDQRWVLENIYCCQQRLIAARAAQTAGRNFCRGHWLTALREIGYAIDHSLRAFRGPRKNTQPDQA